ncbi:hypothetical protein FHG87_012440 [Trinorchestia longiramus]|nr:hypothetical protein FHG87_012440 [Trinorchestia longiramus]
MHSYINADIDGLMDLSILTIIFYPLHNILHFLFDVDLTLFLRTILTTCGFKRWREDKATLVYVSLKPLESRYCQPANIPLSLFSRMEVLIYLYLFSILTCQDRWGRISNGAKYRANRYECARGIWKYVAVPSITFGMNVMAWNGGIE